MLKTPYPIPADEEQRLQGLQDYQILDTEAEDRFDSLVALVARLFDIPIVLISLIAQDRQFFKSRIGLDLSETSREVSFCAHAIMQDDVMVIADALEDARFATNPLVLGPPFIRFYAGKPLITRRGKIGTLCLIDTKPRNMFTATDRKNLTDAAALVVERIEMQRLDHLKSATHAQFENMAATSPDAIVCSNAYGEITFWNRSAERLFGYGASEVVGHASAKMVPHRWRRVYDKELEHLRVGERSALAERTVELAALRKDGSEFPAEFSFSTWKDGQAASVGAIVRDITERRRSEERLLQLASTDALTGIANRSAWRDCAQEWLAARRPVSLLLLDLDGFKEVNDTFGHSAGDAVLTEVGRRLRAVFSDVLIIARLGGDEFVVLLLGNDQRQASAVADEMISVIAGQYEFGKLTAEVGASVGVALAPQHGALPEELLGSADLALYRAKAKGKGRVEIFAPALREVAIARRAFEKELRRAYESGEFELFYQPQVSVNERRVIGAEALIRWNHPKRGLLTPVSFIDVLSKKASAVDIGEWILRTACRQAAEWRKLAPDFRVGVNLFEAQLVSPRLATAVQEILEDNELPPEAVELEIVENIILHNNPATVKMLRNLRELGVGLSFDDYGTGFASLSLLKKCPITRLKIDRSFVQDVNTDSEDAAVVKAVLFLGKSFRLEVIAEGVETEAQLDFLKQNGCPEAQGYLFGKPVPAPKFAEEFLS